VTIYWDRCSVCGRNLVTLQCTMDKDTEVCPHCCTSCYIRDRCSSPAWYPTSIKVVVKRKEAAVKVFSDLMSLLEEKKAVE